MPTLRRRVYGRGQIKTVRAIRNGIFSFWPVDVFRKSNNNNTTTVMCARVRIIYVYAHFFIFFINGSGERRKDIFTAGGVVVTMGAGLSGLVDGPAGEGGWRCGDMPPRR